MRIVCVQQQAPRLADYEKTYKRVLALIDNAARENPHLIVLPEAAYPAYFLGGEPTRLDEILALSPALQEEVAARARKYRTHIGLGVIQKEGKHLYNSGLLFDNRGLLAARVDKSNLWHFDSHYYTPGQDFPVVKTELGRIGLMVCADARLPEIPRLLALRGAEMIIDFVNLTASAPRPQLLTNPQLQYMLQARALENGVWIIVADKVGVEGSTVAYAGGSCVIDPAGNMVEMASPDREENLVVDVDLESGVGCMAQPRRPQEYHMLTAPTESLPAWKSTQEPVCIGATQVQAAVVQFYCNTGRQYLDKARYYIETLTGQDVQLVLLPPMESEIHGAVPLLQKICRNAIVAFTGIKKTGGKRYKETVIFSGEEVFGSYCKSHLAPDEELGPGNMADALLETPLGRLGVMLDQEGYLPEVARLLMLRGAAIILWPDADTRSDNSVILRTRAAENHVYVLRNCRVSTEDYSAISDPRGNIIAATFAGVDMAAAGLLVTAFTRHKTVVPGTDVLQGRQPHLYQELTVVPKEGSGWS